MFGLDPSSPGGANGSASPWFGRMRQSWVLWLYPLLWLLTFVGIRASHPQMFGIPAWYLRTGLIILLLVPLNLYVVRVCWPRMRDD
jgi:hypothetical protein